MPTLENPRHERFAQGLAGGLTQLKAYAEAGYPNPRHAYRLAKSRKVKARVAELMAGAAERAEISVAAVTGALVRLAGKAEAGGAVRELGAARTAWMAAARLNGLMTERGEADGETGGGILSARPLTEAELAEYGVGAALWRRG